MNMKLPKPVKVILIVFVAYAGLVAVFASMIGILQPERETTLVITTTDADGDIIAATSTVAGLDIAHTGIALWRDGRLHLLHAPLAGGVVQISEVPLAERIQRIDGQDGVMVARPVEAR